MIDNIKASRVFLGSPNDLKKERDEFVSVVCQYNARNCENRHLFIPILWEYTSGGRGRAQTRIIKHCLDKCDYAIFIFGETTRSSDAKNNEKAATIEEYETSVVLHKAGKLKDIVVFFRVIPKDRLLDPGSRLQEVIDFKKSIQDKEQYEDFLNSQELALKLTNILSDWSRPVRLMEQKIEKIQDKVDF